MSILGRFMMSRNSTGDRPPRLSTSFTPFSESIQSSRTVRLLQTELRLKSCKAIFTHDLLLTVSSRAAISPRKLEFSGAKLTLMVGSEQITISLERLPDDSVVPSLISELERISRTSKSNSDESSSPTQE